jgi:hypothetical protein
VSRSPGPIGRLHFMEEERPTGITHEAAMEAAQSGGSVDFEGRKARVVQLSDQSRIDEAPSARLELDLGEEYLTLHGYFDRGGEFVETGREHPF